MVYLVYLIGLMIAVGGLFLLLRPSWMIRLMESSGDNPALYVLAIAVRVVLGILLVTQAPLSRYPLAMEVLGWLVLAAALALLLMGQRRFTRFLEWIMRIIRPFAWIGGLFGLLFGAFLIYAFSG